MNIRNRSKFACSYACVLALSCPKRLSSCVVSTGRYSLLGILWLCMCLQFLFLLQQADVCRLERERAMERSRKSDRRWERLREGLEGGARRGEGIERRRGRKGGCEEQREEGRKRARRGRQEDSETRVQRLVMHDLRADVILSLCLHMHVQAEFIPRKETSRVFVPLYLYKRARICEKEMQHRQKLEVIDENENLESSGKRNLCPVVSRLYRDSIHI